ncbi:MAG TPA: hypothetical protein VGF18_07605 [Candidatus Tumulicola sp.]
MASRFLLASALMLSGCAASSGRLLEPAAVVVAPHTWPTPQTQTPQAPPRILAFWMNETDLRPGRQWLGRIVTSTNVASVEIRTESFSFTADRHAFGEFAFSQDFLDIVPQYRRPYVLHVIARNTAGASDELLVPIVIH